jgi:alkanesulfonate monooxygenase SsuD/methylene tetrahydromethanopterin reductase-like flavin-dependent oxidoreductase (luciferase family)
MTAPTEEPGMKFGLLQIFQNHLSAMPDAQMWDEEVRLALLAEELGFDSVWVVEHHFRDYAACPDNLQYLTYLAARTKRITLATGAVIVPWNNPLRVAEKVSVLDHLSGGRAHLGLGRGLARNEYAGFGIEMSTSRERFDEAAAMILDALDSGFIEGDGRYYPQARTEIRPRPRAGFRDRVTCIAMSPDSIDAAAALGGAMAVFSQAPWEVAVNEMNRYRDLFRAKHGRAAPPPVTADITVCHTDAGRAEQLARAHVAGYLRTVYDHYELLSKHFQDAKGYEMYAHASTVLRDIGLEAVEQNFLDVQAWGTPEQILARLETRREIIGDFDLNVCFRHAGIAYEDAANGMRLFAEKVMPALR